MWCPCAWAAVACCSSAAGIACAAVAGVLGTSCRCYPSVLGFELLMMYSGSILRSLRICGPLHTLHEDGLAVTL